jgi:hypothetical protein
LCAFLPCESQGMASVESALLQVAAACGLAPEAVREINLIKDGVCAHHNKSACGSARWQVPRCWVSVVQ